MTQGQEILAHIKDHGSITSMVAFSRYNVTRLSGVIFTLRKKHDIHTTLRTEGDSTYAIYSMETK